jgi:HPt (histidine-containing phosphotransfer) domain-containing protein
MDVQMPDMDGLEATRCIRGELGLTTLPVIALTAGALVEERKRAIDAGMQGFLPKPLDPAQLIRTLRRLVEAARGVALPVMGLDQVTSPGVLDWPHIEGIDASDVQHRLGNDLPLFLLMLRRLLFEFADLSRIESPAFADPLQRRALQARMHRLRGSAGTVGARELHQRAAVAEASLRNEDSGAEAAVREAASSLDALAELAQHALATRAPGGDLPEARAEEFTGDPRAALEGLAEQLRSRDLAALDAFSRLAPMLRRMLGELATRALSDALDALEFEQASEILSGGLRNAPVALASV